MDGPEAPAELIGGLWRWMRAPPDWRPTSRPGGPDDWEQLVGCAPRARLPAGVEPVVLRGAGETMFWLPGPRALIPGDRLLGAPAGGLRICPQSWLSRVRVDREELRGLLAPVLEVGVVRVLVSHGRPVLRGGAAALRAALSE